MTLGPGKYDDMCEYVAAHAGIGESGGGVVVMVVGGNKGSGFSVKADIRTTMGLPDLLEYVAREIRATHHRGEL